MDTLSIYAMRFIMDISKDSNAKEIRITVRSKTHPNPKPQNSPSIPVSSILAIGVQT